MVEQIIDTEDVQAAVAVLGENLDLSDVNAIDNDALIEAARTALEAAETDLEIALMEASGVDLVTREPIPGFEPIQIDTSALEAKIRGLQYIVEKGVEALKIEG